MGPTRLQLSRKGRIQKKRRNKVPCLYNRPHKRALVFKLGILPPRKPNSAKRKHVKLRILGEKFKGRRTLAHIPGWDKHGLHEYSIVLIEGGGPKDTPGVNYTAMRGLLDFVLPTKQRTRSRSKFGLTRRDVFRNSKFDYPRWWGNPQHPDYPKNPENIF